MIFDSIVHVGKSIIGGAGAAAMVVGAASYVVNVPEPITGTLIVGGMLLGGFLGFKSIAN
ncbi:MAG: hypothetical protein CMH98_03700 [Oceanospirillaceae bacterium]|nr:hypothetical protein [Oceanospirillaceae bacterium]